MRGFIGYLLTPDETKELKDIQTWIKSEYPGFRCEEHLHTTIAFLGDEAEKLIESEELLAARIFVRDTPSTQCHYTKFGITDSGSLYVQYMPVFPALTRLLIAVNTKHKACKEPLLMHVTLGKAKWSVASEILRKLGKPQFKTGFKITKLNLISSTGGQYAEN